MSISQELFYAILSLDSYNRGYGAGLTDGGVGDPDGLGEAGFVGDVRILARPNGVDYAAWQAASFYAVAYEDPSGNIVISYRGTDAPLSDLWSGWTTGAGHLSAQGELAAQFYNQVKQAYPTKTITLTGHSLGGGLAGFVAKPVGWVRTHRLRGNGGFHPPENCHPRESGDPCAGPVGPRFRGDDRLECG